MLISLIIKKEIKGDKDKMEELKQKLLDACNTSGLPLEAIYYVTKDLWRDVEATLRHYQVQQQKEVSQNKE